MRVLGENGAGKSTLIKIIAGVVQPDEGRIVLEGDRSPLRASRSAAVAAGIACIFQELSLLPDLSVADNICITNPPRPPRPHRPPGAAARRRGGAGARRAREDIHPLAPVATCRCRAARWSRSPRRWRASRSILILDEATSALTARRRRAGLRAAQAAARRGPGDRSTSRTACTRSPSSPTTARCSATAATSRPSPPAPERRRDRRDDDRPRHTRMSSRPSPPRARPPSGAPALDVRDLSLERPAARHLARRAAAARSSASAASTARASASSCWRCSACCAA